MSETHNFKKHFFWLLTIKFNKCSQEESAWEGETEEQWRPGHGFGFAHMAVRFQDLSPISAKTHLYIYIYIKLHASTSQFQTQLPIHPSIH